MKLWIESWNWIAKVIAKRHKFTKSEQREFDLIFYVLKDKDQEKLNDIWNVTPEYLHS